MPFTITEALLLLRKWIITSYLKLRLVVISGFINSYDLDLNSSRTHVC